VVFLVQDCEDVLGKIEQAFRSGALTGADAAEGANGNADVAGALGAHVTINAHRAAITLPGGGDAYDEFYRGEVDVFLSQGEGMGGFQVLDPQDFVRELAAASPAVRISFNHQ
jgi:hypothetical protein